MWFRFRPLLIGAAVLSSFTGVAPADETSVSTDALDGASRAQLDAVVVTSQRRAESIQDVPTTVTAISGDYVLSADLGSSAANITYLVANTSAGETAPTRPRWWIRGVGTGAQGFDVQSPVGVYFDDVYFSNANATGQPIFDLERVELLEGPQGTLWGKNTTGGAIDFISAKPAFTPSGYAKVDRSSYDDLLVEGAYGNSIIDDVLAARAAFHAESSSGAYDNTYTGTTETRFHDDSGRLQFLANLSSDWTALLNVHYRDYYGNGNPWTVIGTGPNGQYYKDTPNTPGGYTPNPDPSSTAQNAPNTTQIRQEGVALTVTGQLGRNALTSITGYEGFQTVAFSDSDDTPLEILRGWNSGHTQQFSEELRLASPRSDRWNWLVGGMWFDEDINSQTVSAILPNAATGATPTGLNPKYLYTSFLQNTKSYSGFGSSTFNVTDRFNITGGLRYTKEIKGDDLNILSAPAAPANPLSQYNNVSSWWLPRSVNGLKSIATQNLTKGWGAWTYDVTPEYKITDHARAYFKYAHGFRAGGYNSSATSAANIGVVNPEHLTSYELGAKSEWLDGRLTANADVFYYKYDDIQINVVTSGVSQLTNAGAGKAHGAEVTVEALPLDNLHVRVNVGWLDTKFTDYTTGGISYAGNAFVRSPRNTDVVSADYRFPLANGASLLLATDWRYTSKYYFYSNDQVDPNVTQQGFTLGDARLSYIVGKVAFTGYVNNVTDKIYKQHTLLQTNSTAPTPSNIYLGGDAVSWSEGRTFGGSFTVRW
ncbi:MAG: iron complex outerrane recepter protein [Gammaproteobacteria bacterium]|nr:iron complex outerrane recepter protein [Gammaproteobacteria bacterium]